MAIASTISLPATNYADTDYFAVFSGDTIRVFRGCPYRSSYGQTMDYTSYNAIFGFPMAEGSQNISNITFTLDSSSCNSRDSGPHGQLAITSNALDVVAYLPFKPFYYTLSVITFIWTMSFIIHLFFGRRANT